MWNPDGGSTIRSILPCTFNMLYKVYCHPNSWSLHSAIGDCRKKDHVWDFCLAVFYKVCFLLNHLLFFQVCRHFSLGTQTLKHSSSRHQYQKYSWEVQFNNSDLLVQHVADSWQHWPAIQSTHALNRATFTIIVKQLRFAKIRPACSCHEQEN